jgi:ring-1,2-phenylacetyl-CoA epoxidase subunit PaaE
MTAAQFHTLTVGSVATLTDDSVIVTFDVPDELAESYRFTPGQHVIVRADIDGEDVRRSYSICSSAASEELRVAVRQIDGGAFSTYANTRLAAGDTLSVTPPTGEFVLAPDPSNSMHYLAIAAGSGITPIMSMIATTLEEEPDSVFTLLFGNRDGLSIMFLEELAALKDRFPARFVLMHFLSRELNTIPLFEGRIDGEKLETLFASVIDADSVDKWYLCGPAGLVDEATTLLRNRGVSDAEIHQELFFADRDAVRPAPPVIKTEEGTVVNFTLGGRTSTTVVPTDGAPILDYVLAVRRDAPFSCRNGACASCRSIVLEGEVTMDHNWCLTQEEVDAGQILTCQAHPVSQNVVLSFDI